MMIVESRPSSCRLKEIAEGVVEPCPGEPCAFWEPGSAVAGAGCLIDRLGVDAMRKDLAEYLLETRMRLEEARSLAEAERAHSEFSRRIGVEL